MLLHLSKRNACYLPSMPTVFSLVLPGFLFVNKLHFCTFITEEVAQVPLALLVDYMRAHFVVTTHKLFNGQETSYLLKWMWNIMVFPSTIQPQGIGKGGGEGVPGHLNIQKNKIRVFFSKC